MEVADNWYEKLELKQKKDGMEWFIVNV